MAFLTARSYRLFFPLKPEFIAVHCGFTSFTITDHSFTPTLSSYFIEAGETAHAFGFKTTFLRAIDDDNGSGHNPFVKGAIVDQMIAIALGN